MPRLLLHASRPRSAPGSQAHDVSAETAAGELVVGPSGAGKGAVTGVLGVPIFVGISIRQEQRAAPWGRA